MWLIFNRKQHHHVFHSICNQLQNDWDLHLLFNAFESCSWRINRILMLIHNVTNEVINYDIIDEFSPLVQSFVLFGDFYLSLSKNVACYEILTSVLYFVT